MRAKLLIVALVAIVGVLGLGIQAQGAVVTLTFEGIANLAPIGNYYGGGAGPDYGIVFGPDSLALVDADAGGSGNTGNEPTPQTTLLFLSGPGAVMNVAAGFTTGFSFYYAAPYYPGSVTVYDGLDGTGALLGSLSLAINGPGPGDPSGQYSNWTATGVAFAGTAKSAVFSGTANYIVFDNITLGADKPGNGTIPLPGAALSGLALMVGVGARKLARRPAKA